ncbi:hypothetical protein [Natronobacterium texcoconense]|uniref:Uncharacterized protein n=1 Tax=Natronobacterium texcoconense TaxID=1095778 RepID=A0A1H1GM26_NATTX|nr:hypothetical protein [Natronobacterium texcoconense]SDR13938.1 hypothetical protein SAMN04489842_2486 [Natronobacterium texcoconense]
MISINVVVLWISWHPIEFVFVPVWLIIGGLCGLSLVDPELAFRYENIFQLREAELTAFGVVLQVGGGLLALLLVGPYTVFRLSPIGAVTLVSFYGSAAIVLIKHWPPKF